MNRKGPGESQAEIQEAILEAATAPIAPEVSGLRVFLSWLSRCKPDAKRVEGEALGERFRGLCRGFVGSGWIYAARTA